MKKEEKNKKVKKVKKEKSQRKNILNVINAKVIKISTILLAIILVALVSFVGVYKQNKNTMSNTVKDYTYAMDINGARNIRIKVNDENKTVVKDKDGNEVEDATDITDEKMKEEGYTKEEIPNNKEEDKNLTNYKLAKTMLEKRLKKLGVQEYSISLNETNGIMDIAIPENKNTDNVVSKLNSMGKFEIIDAETKEVLMDNNDIKSSGVLYNNTEKGTAVYLDITFNNEGKKKLADISKSYVKVEEKEDEGNTASEESSSTEDNTTSEEQATEESTDETKEEKQITMKINDEEIMTTSFDEPIETGKIQLTVGSASKDTSTLEGYIQQAENIAVPLDSGRLPLKYDVENNQYVLSTISHKVIVAIEITVAVVAALGVIVLIIKYKSNGVLAAFAYVGFAAIFVLLVRYANVIISLESVFGIIAILALDYIFTKMLLDRVKEQSVAKATVDTYVKYFFKVLPICIMAIAFCFVKWIPISSFGMITFWGLTLIAAYNAIITRYLLKVRIEDK